MYLRYLWRLLRHKWYVFVAGLGTVPLWRLLVHDLSKFGRKEFGPYARRFVKGRAGTLDHSKDPQEWQKAWLHHWHHNPHHWEHWLRLDGDKLVPLVMPLTYVHEMIADWKGASRVYTGSWDIGEWYTRNRERMILHPDTRFIVESLLYGMSRV